MKQYLYSLLLLTALSSQLKGMNENAQLIGEAYRHIEYYNTKMNDREWPNARISIVGFLRDYPVPIIARIMADYERSPLMTAVKANQVRIVGVITADNKFLQIEQRQQTQFLRDALAVADELGLREMTVLLEGLIALDEELPDEDEDDEDQDEDIN